MILNLICFLCCVCAGAVILFTDLGFVWGAVLAIGTWLGSFVALVLLSVAFLWVCCAFVDFDKPQSEYSPFYSRLAAVYIAALIRIFRVRVHTQGLEKTPGGGRFLLVCNHQHEADPGVLLHYFKDSRLAFISKQENRTLPFVGPIMHKLLCQLIDRDNDRQALKGILNCINIIREDKASVAVFPEGGIKGVGKLYPFRPGVFKIAIKTNVPIVVCTLRNTELVLKNGLRGRPTDVELHLVDVIEPERYAEMKTTQLSDMVHALMLQDLGSDFLLEP